LPKDDLGFDRFDNMKHILKLVIASILYYSGLLALIARMSARIRPKYGITVLLYHRVLETDDESWAFTQDGMNTSVRSFRSQMQFLRKHYKVTSLTNLCTWLRNGQQIPNRTVVITFDDGWRDNFQCAYPILKEFRLPATIFVSTGYTESNRTFWFLKLGYLLASGCIATDDLESALGQEGQHLAIISEHAQSGHEKLMRGDLDWITEALKKLPSTVIDKVITTLESKAMQRGFRPVASGYHLDWEEIRAMDPSLIEIGSHGNSHRILTQLERQQVIEELVISKQVLENQVGGEIASFAYPNGDYDESIKKLVQMCGYHCAVTTRSHDRSDYFIDAFAIERQGIHEGRVAGLYGKFSPALFSLAMINFRRTDLYGLISGMISKNGS
jgi:peptidoglycan/xylan/chitin deacetylase (PgdA/CDA1 family)